MRTLLWRWLVGDPEMPGLDVPKLSVALPGNHAQRRRAVDLHLALHRNANLFGHQPKVPEETANYSL